MKISELVLDILAPDECLMCGFEGSALCEPCTDDARSPLPERCFLCLKQNIDYRTCSTCRRKAPIVSVWVASEYENGIKQAIKVYKFKRRRSLAMALSQLLAKQLPYFDRAPLVVPVPTATVRLRQRGFDHAALLAQELARLQNWPYMELLRRNTQTRQVGAKELQRRQQMERAFRSIRTELMKNREILLIDDVVTTGATLSEAAKTLKTAGAKRIYAAVVAHKS